MNDAHRPMFLSRVFQMFAYVGAIPFLVNTVDIVLHPFALALDGSMAYRLVSGLLVAPRDSDYCHSVRAARARQSHRMDADHVQLRCFLDGDASGLTSTDADTYDRQPVHLTLLVL
ncbi:MAG: hypothetical protein ABI835_09355, partial [Chloroflexota bacterium]